MIKCTRHSVWISYSKQQMHQREIQPHRKSQQMSTSNPFKILCSIHVPNSAISAWAPVFFCLNLVRCSIWVYFLGPNAWEESTSSWGEPSRGTSSWTEYAKYNVTMVLIKLSVRQQRMHQREIQLHRKSYSGRLRRAPNVLRVTRKYTKVLQ